jgi:hypothetical protein
MSKDGVHQTDAKKLETPATQYAASAEEHLDLNDPDQRRLYEIYRPEHVTPHQRLVYIQIEVFLWIDRTFWNKTSVSNTFSSK